MCGMLLKLYLRDKLIGLREPIVEEKSKINDLQKNMSKLNPKQKEIKNRGEKEQNRKIHESEKERGHKLPMSGMKEATSLHNLQTLNE